MDDNAREEFWRWCDRQRGHMGRESHFDLLARFASESGQELDVDDLRWLAAVRNSREFGLLCPPFILEFVAALAMKSGCRSVLDPWAGAGSLLIPLVERLAPARAVGIESDIGAFRAAQVLDHTGQIDWLTGDALTGLEGRADTFDLVSACLPLGFSRASVTIAAPNAPVEVRDEVPYLAMLRACTRLSPEGIGAFVVSPGFFAADKRKGAYASLGACGLHLSGYLAIPGGAFAPVTSVRTALALVSRSETKRVFVGELGADDARVQSLVARYVSGKSSKELSTGQFVEASAVRSYDSLAAEQRAEGLARRMGLPRVRLADVALELNLADKTLVDGFLERANAVYLPLIGRGPAVDSLSELSIKPQNYLQVVLKPEIADARFVAALLNTSLGLAIRSSLVSGTYIPKATKTTVAGAMLYLPSLAIQRSAVGADTRLRELKAEVTGLQSQLWNSPNAWKQVLERAGKVNREERFADWLETLPFPLASVLWAYHALGDRPKDQYEHLDHFFQATAEFMATVLLSGFAGDASLFRDEWSAVAANLREHHQSVEISSFGMWVAIAGHFAALARTMLSGDSERRVLCCELFKSSEPERLLQLFSSKLVGILQKTNAYRNDWVGHTGIVGEETARERLAVLLSNLTEYQAAIGDAWSHIDLVTPREIHQRQGTFHVTVDRVMGSRTPFEKVDLQLGHSLEDDRLHLIGEEERDALELLPFVRVMASPSTAQNACYFYNRREGTAYRYISYHFEADSEVVNDFPDMREAIELLAWEPPGLRSVK